MEGLLSGDTSLIAEKLSVSKQQVHAVLTGKRIKRQTLSQVKVVLAAKYCRMKNLEKSLYISELAQISSLHGLKFSTKNDNEEEEKNG